MAEIIDMPKLSDTMTVGTLVKWLKEEGDEINSGDMVCEVETDKATMEVESFFDGILLKKYAQDGAEVPIGGPICAVGESGEEAPAVDAAPAAAPAEEKKEEAKPAAAPAAPAPVAAPATPAPAPVVATPVASSGPVKASPLARKIAAEKGLDLGQITGSGPSGRIVKKDVVNAKPTPAGGGLGSAASKGPIADEQSIPVSNMRRVIASRLVESKNQVPHFYLEIEVDAAPLLKLRADLNQYLAEQGGIKLTVNDFILKGATDALRKVPSVNASWMGDTIQQHGNVHMSFGVAIDDGLVTPVIRDANLKSLTEISTDAKALIGKARGKKLTPNEMSGSTFTVTNLGMFGISSFYGIINTPNAAILSVGATIKKPVVDQNDNIVIGQRMVIGLSGDHRVVDGANGAEFLAALKNILETPALMLV